MTNTIECEFCGARLAPLLVEMGGRKVPLGYEFCHCEKAEEARMARMAEDDAHAEKSRLAEVGRKLRKAGIPERYLDAKHEATPSMADSISSGRGYYIDGQQGAGKSHLAMAVARECVLRNMSVKVVIVPDFIDSMRSRETEDRDATAKMAKCQLLVLDDLGKESPTAYACERLFSVINDRYNAMKPVIVTSNYTRGEIARKLTEGDVGKSIASRLCEMTQRIHLECEDRRLNG